LAESLLTHPSKKKKISDDLSQSHHAINPPTQKQPPLQPLPPPPAPLLTPSVSSSNTKTTTKPSTGDKNKNIPVFSDKGISFTPRNRASDCDASVDVDKQLHKKSKKEPTEFEVGDHKINKHQHYKSNTILPSSSSSSSSLNIPSHNLSQNSTAPSDTSGVSISKTTSTYNNQNENENENEQAHNQESEYNNFGLEEFYGDNTMDQFSLLHGPEDFSML